MQLIPANALGSIPGVSRPNSHLACDARDTQDFRAGQVFPFSAAGGQTAATEAAVAINDAEAPGATSIASGKKIRVLVVEDEALIALVLTEILEEMGFDVCASETTEAGAVAAALRQRPNLMIVDARLREGSGISAVESILSDHFIPHVFVSGDRLPGDGLHPRAVVLQKPYMEAELALAIQRALGPGPI